MKNNNENEKEIEKIQKAIIESMFKRFSYKYTFKDRLIDALLWIVFVAIIMIGIAVLFVGGFGIVLIFELVEATGNALWFLLYFADILIFAGGMALIRGAVRFYDRHF